MFKDWIALWRPKRSDVAAHIAALKALPFLAYEGRRLNGNGERWRSFHFRVIGTDWVAILHDQGANTTPWTIFARRPPGTTYGDSFSSFERFLSQMPQELQAGFSENAHLFQPAKPAA